MLFSSCAQNPDGMLKRSANDRVFDVNGFDGSKRRPLYNKKYIAKAKKNVLEKEFEDEEDDDEFDEIYDPAIYHRQMYEKMVARDRAYHGKVRKKKQYYAKKISNGSRDSMTLQEGDIRLKDIPRRDISAIEQEVQSLRMMLEETKSELLQQQAEARKAKEEAMSAIEIAKQELAAASVKDSEVSVQKQRAADAAIQQQRYQEESLKALEEKRETLKEKLLSDKSLLSATSDTDLASEVIKVIENNSEDIVN